MMKNHTLCSENEVSEMIKDILHQVGEVTSALSGSIWPVFLPLLLAASGFIIFVTTTRFRHHSKKSKQLSLKEMIGPGSISLGAKIGTGAIIGVLGSLSKLSASGQIYIEGILLWGLISAVILIRFTYSETLICRIIDKTPAENIRKHISPIASTVYISALIALYVFGFGGFQFNGIDTVFSIAYGYLTHETLVEMQRYVFIVIPVVLGTSVIVLTKKHVIFINALSSMIGIAVLLYFSFFIYFVSQTTDFIGIFLNRMLGGVLHPVSMGIGVPVGMIFSLQRIIQTSEAGLGTSPLAALEDRTMSPHNSAITQVVPTAITVVASLFITTYITSYGMHIGVIVLPAEGAERMLAFFGVAHHIAGVPGILILSVFALFSGATTLLGSYFYMAQLLVNNRDHTNIIIFIGMITTAGTLSVFGFDVVFDIVDILLFVVSGLNVYALMKIAGKIVKRERKDFKDIEQGRDSA